MNFQDYFQQRAVQPQMGGLPAPPKTAHQKRQAALGPPQQYEVSPHGRPAAMGMPAPGGVTPPVGWPPQQQQQNPYADATNQYQQMLEMLRSMSSGIQGSTRSMTPTPTGMAGGMMGGMPNLLTRRRPPRFAPPPVGGTPVGNPFLPRTGY